MIAISFGCVCVCVGGFESQLRASFTSFRQLLHCARKRIVIIMKVYIERKNKQVELIRFRQKISISLTLETFKWEFTFATEVFTKLG